eukprot:CAMPEP_0177615216 /NCGR_PEP_ID=MMETSP0419_2-20121207/23277_1 /TAXON_ID=582737 /ORGANISM="Tetraselmis sp., Strain GSL018" /LENGTH=130 /DNA_ID=CAMNT_0019112739 /DNA_START=224 /DNA_END=617 /DNA_ORIENTATION=-
MAAQNRAITGGQQWLSLADLGRPLNPIFNHQGNAGLSGSLVPPACDTVRCPVSPAQTLPLLLRRLALFFRIATAGCSWLHPRNPEAELSLRVQNGQQEKAVTAASAPYLHLQRVRQPSSLSRARSGWGAP